MVAPPPALLIPAEADELDKGDDSFPDFSARNSLSSTAQTRSKQHQHKASLHLAPSLAPVTYQLSALPLSSPPPQSERQAFLTNAALRSTFVRQGSLLRLGTLRGGVASPVLSPAYRPPLPVVVRQESRIGFLTRQPTVRFAAAAASASTFISQPNTSSDRPDPAVSSAKKARLPSYVPIVQVADSFVYRSEADDDERCQYGYEVMPVLSSLLEHQSRYVTCPQPATSDHSWTLRIFGSLTADFLALVVRCCRCCCQSLTSVPRMVALVCMLW